MQTRSDDWLCVKPVLPIRHRLVSEVLMGDVIMDKQVCVIPGWFHISHDLFCNISNTRVDEGKE